jgi:hypothetical protein
MVVRDEAPTVNDFVHVTSPLQPNLRLMLFRDHQPLFALLDSSRDPRILNLLRESRDEFESLFQGEQGQKLAHFAPYLVRLSPESPLLEILIGQGWSKSWGVYITCDKSFQEIRSHLRRCLMVKLPDGRRVYFRYYDPRVLRVYLPTCSSEESKQIFGPVKCYTMEDEVPGNVLSFMYLGRSVERKLWRPL